MRVQYALPGGSRGRLDRGSGLLGACAAQVLRARRCRLEGTQQEHGCALADGNGRSRRSLRPSERSTDGPHMSGSRCVSVGAGIRSTWTRFVCCVLISSESRFPLNSLPLLRATLRKLRAQNGITNNDHPLAARTAETHAGKSLQPDRSVAQMDSPEANARRQAVARWRIVELLRERLVAQTLESKSASEMLDRLAAEVASRELDPYSAVEEILGRRS